MTALTQAAHVEPNPSAELPVRPPRFGGVLWRLSRRTNGWALPLAGRRWNPILGLVIHRGRRSGRPYATPVAARRVADGFIMSLAFGAQVDWHRNLVVAGGGTIRWRGRDYEVAGPETIGADEGGAAFDPVQRLFLRLAGVDGFIRVRDAAVTTR
jgi:deazaflavin-dependent oxidoreductase (nitroreductase family)